MKEKDSLIASFFKLIRKFNLILIIFFIDFKVNVPIYRKFKIKELEVIEPTVEIRDKILYN
jgi:hypothetical protein